MKNRHAILGIGLAVVAFAAVFTWLIWGTDVPDKQTQGTRPAATAPVVENTVLTREEKGKLLWKFNVKQSQTQDQNTIQMKGIEGDVYMSDGDVMHIVANAGVAQVKENQFKLTEGVTAKLQNASGFLRAEQITYDKKQDILKALGKVRIVRDKHLITGDEAETDGKFSHFKLKGNAYLERGGNYEEK